MQIRAFLADDEQAARLRLRRLLARHPQIGIVGEAEDGPEAVDAIERLRPDLLFLDVQMPGLNGFEVLQGLSKDVPRPLTIFITGFHEYALDAFRERAIAYLLKPIEEDHLQEMIERARRLLVSSAVPRGGGAQRRLPVGRQFASHGAAGGQKGEPCLLVRSGGRAVFLHG